MSKIVNGGKTSTHIIKPYNFRELGENEEFSAFKKEDIVTVKPEVEVQKEEPKKDNSAEIIENLLKKIEELSQLVEKGDSGCEDKLKECFDKLTQEKQKAFEEGYQKAVDELKAKYEDELKTLRGLFEDSIKKLSELNKIFEDKLATIEKDLISVALDIAHEVIQKEVSENSKEVAKSLAKAMMEELKTAKKVTIKVNPKDAEALKDIEGVEVIADEAVKEGGIVIISDVGNIDAEIDERFKNIKEAILKARSG